MLNKENLQARLQAIQNQIEELEDQIDNLERDEKRLKRQLRNITPISIPARVVQIPPALSEKRKQLQKLFIFLSSTVEPTATGREPLKFYLDQLRGVLSESRRTNELVTDEKLTSWLINELTPITRELEDKFKSLVIRIKSETF